MMRTSVEQIARRVRRLEGDRTQWLALSTLAQLLGVSPADLPAPGTAVFTDAELRALEAGALDARH
jgi:hypothetical protein